jgi:hypothetical protein
LAGEVCRELRLQSDNRTRTAPLYPRSASSAGRDFPRRRARQAPPPVEM